MNAIKTSLEKWSSILNYKNISTIFFGGGSPSYINSKYIEELLNIAKTKFNLLPNAEITLETNPNDVTLSKLNDYLKFGINRLSLGIQTMDNELLKTLGRRHNAEEAKNAVILAYKAGFTNISVDLMYGLPKQSTNSLSKTLKEILSLQPTHISAYALTVEPHTILKKLIEKGKINNVNDKTLREQNEIIVLELEKSKYINYELSSFALNNYQSKNNTSYWKRKKYMGLGPSAHSFNGSQRIWNISNNVKYIKSIGNNKLPQSVENLTEVDIYNEMVMTGLRTIWGISLDSIEKNLGEKFKNYLVEKSKDKIDNKLIKIDNNFIKITKRGRFLSDGIASDMFMVN